METGEAVEFTVNVKNLATPLRTNQPFNVEVIPAAGATISFQVPATAATPLRSRVSVCPCLSWLMLVAAMTPSARASPTRHPGVHRIPGLPPYGIRRLLG